jgi:hypothetical protein
MRAVEVLEGVGQRHGLPKVIRVDRGPSSSPANLICGEVRPHSAIGNKPPITLIGPSTARPDEKRLSSGWSSVGPPQEAGNFRSGWFSVRVAQKLPDSTQIWERAPGLGHGYSDL